MNEMLPPPPGFELEEDQGIPAPPPGFELVGDTASALPADDGLSKLRTASGGFLEGIPVVGPMIRGGVERVAAATIAPFSDLDYGQVLQHIQQGSADEKAANPILDTGSQIAGAVAGTVPMVMAAPAAFGAGGGGLFARSMTAGGTGMVMGGADSAVRSGGSSEAVQWGAGAGLAMGLAGPIAGRVVGKGYQAARDVLARRSAAAATDIPASSLRHLDRAMQDDALSPALARDRLAQLGPDAMLADLGPNLQRQAGAVAAMPSRAQEIIRNALVARDAAANGRITGAVDETLGRAVVPSEIEAGIQGNQQALSPAYEQVFRGARGVDTEPLAQTLESAAVNLRGPGQRAAQDVRRMLNIVGTDELDPNPYTLFQTRQAIDGMLAANADTNATRVLSMARQQVDDTLARAVPGIKDVDASFAELARQREALGRGQQVLESGRTSPRPAELAQQFNEGALPQGRQIGPSAVPVRMQQGARDEIERIIGTNANDRVALHRLVKGEGDWNRSRLATLFGEDRANRIINVLDRERIFADTSAVVTRNSETAARNAAMQELGGSSPSFGSREAYMSGGTLGLARGAAVRGVERIAGLLAASNRDVGTTGLARALSTGDYDGILTALEHSKTLGGASPESVERIARMLVLTGGPAAARP